MEALQGFAEGVLPDQMLFHRALGSAYSKLDNTQHSNPKADLRLGYEFLEHIEAMGFRGGVEAATNGKKAGKQELIDKRRRAALTDETDQGLLESLLVLKYTAPKARILSMALLAEFGTINNVLNATEPRIKMIYGADQKLIDVLDLARTIKMRALLDESCRQKPIKDTSQVLDYAVASMANLDIVNVKVMYLDRARELIGIETLQTGDCDSARVFPRQLVARALDLSAKYLIVFHNQPDGTGDSSFGFFENLKCIEDSINKLGIYLLDYVLVSPELCYSLKELRALEYGNPTPLLFQPKLD
ncbi:JAB domain-containing protein [Roseibium algae]|uniref:JAB domain-containing protein n=1 Tax=Roseibium algae TaxID=3123038 RepID=A0ABU8TRU8_9HYPH